MAAGGGVVELSQNMTWHDELADLRRRWDVSTPWRRSAALAFVPLFVVLIWANVSGEEELIIRKTTGVVFGVFFLFFAFAQWRDYAAKRRNERNTPEGIDP